MANGSAAGSAELRELRRGEFGPCVLALLESRPRFGLELVRDLAAADGLLTGDGTVYPLLNRLRDDGLRAHAVDRAGAVRANPRIAVSLHEADMLNVGFPPALFPASVPIPPHQARVLRLN
jgi:hypothetical protein